MKCGGLDPRTHEVMKELSRVQLYVKKFQTHKKPKGTAAHSQPVSSKTDTRAGKKSSAVPPKKLGVNKKK